MEDSSIRPIKTGSILWLALIIVLLPIDSVRGQAYEIEVVLPDSIVEESFNGQIPILFKNHLDTIAGIRMQINIDPPGVIAFDGPPYLDTVGTLFNDWQVIYTYSENGYDNDIIIWSLANAVPPPINLGIPPQNGAELLRLNFRFIPLPDSVGYAVVNLTFNNDFFSFSDPWGRSLGIIIDTLIDCLEYEGDSCVLADTTITGYLDTNAVFVKNGSLSVINVICGDMNQDGYLNLLDVTCHIDFLYQTKNRLDCPGLPCDFNQDDNVNLLDVIYVIDYLYKGGSGPPY